MQYIMLLRILLVINRLGATTIADIERKIAEKKIEIDNINLQSKKLEEQTKKKIDEYEEAKNLLKNVVNNSQSENLNSDEIELLQKKSATLSREIHENDPQLIQHSSKCMEIKREIKKLEWVRQTILNNSEQSDDIDFIGQKNKSMVNNKMQSKRDFDENCNSSGVLIYQDISVSEGLKVLTPEIHITNSSNVNDQTVSNVHDDSRLHPDIDDLPIPQPNVISGIVSATENLVDFKNIDLTTPQVLDNLRNSVDCLNQSITNTNGYLKNEFNQADLFENSVYPEAPNYNNINFENIPNYPFDENSVDVTQSTNETDPVFLPENSVNDEILFLPNDSDILKQDYDPANIGASQSIGICSQDVALENLINNKLLCKLNEKNGVGCDFSSEDHYDVNDCHLRKKTNISEMDFICSNDFNVKNCSKQQSNDILIPELVYFNNSNSEKLSRLETDNVSITGFVSDDFLGNYELGFSDMPFDPDNLPQPQNIEVARKLAPEISFDAEPLLKPRNESINSDLNPDMPTKNTLSADIYITTQDRNLKQTSDSLPDHNSITENHNLPLINDDLGLNKPMKNCSFPNAISPELEKNNLHAENDSKSELKSTPNSTLITDIVEESSKTSANLTKALNLFDDYLKEKYIESDDSESQITFEVPVEAFKKDKNIFVEEDKVDKDIELKEMNVTADNNESEKCDKKTFEQKNETKTDQINSLNDVNSSLGKNFEEEPSKIKESFCSEKDGLKPNFVLEKVDNEIENLKIVERNIDLPEVVNESKQNIIEKSNGFRNLEFANKIVQISKLKDKILSKFDSDGFIYIINAFDNLLKELSCIFEQDNSSINTKKTTEALLNGIKNHNIIDEPTEDHPEKNLKINIELIDKRAMFFYMMIGLIVITLLIIFFLFLRKNYLFKSS